MPRLRPQPEGGALHLESGMSKFDDTFGDVLDEARRSGVDVEASADAELSEFMGVAWAEAETALPEWSVRSLECEPPGPTMDGRYHGTWVGEPSEGGDWLACADPYKEGLEFDVDDDDDDDRVEWARGDTPAAALRALAAKLRDR